MEGQTIAKLLLLLDLQRERLVVPKVQGCHLVTQRELLRAPLPAKRSCTGLTEPELVAQREEGLQTQFPGVQVAVWLNLAEPTPERFWKGAVLVNSQPVANLNISIKRF